jgi:ankyrin repeat protein
MMNRTHEIKSNLLNNLKNPWESLLFYLKDDNFVKFKEIIEKHKTLIEEKDELGNTILNLAAQFNSPEIFKFLIEIGADVNTQNV